MEGSKKQLKLTQRDMDLFYSENECCSSTKKIAVYEKIEMLEWVRGQLEYHDIDDILDTKTKELQKSL